MKYTDFRGDLLNTPNILSIFRILLIPFFVYFFCKGDISIALLIFLTAGITDVADGYIARKYNKITELGKILDPFADKAMQITVLVTMAAQGLMPWLAVMIIMAKEVMMFLGGVFLFRKNVVVGANFYGKIATVVTTVCVAAILMFYEILPQNLFLFFQWLPVLFAALAFLRYLVIFVGILGDKIKKAQM